MGPAAASTSARPLAALDEYRVLGRSGLRVSPLCYGGMNLGTEWGFGADHGTSRWVPARDRGGWGRRRGGGLTGRRTQADGREVPRARRQFLRHGGRVHRRHLRALARRVPGAASQPRRDRHQVLGVHREGEPERRRERAGESDAVAGREPEADGDRVGGRALRAHLGAPDAGRGGDAGAGRRRAERQGRLHRGLRHGRVEDCAGQHARPPPGLEPVHSASDAGKGAFRGAGRRGPDTPNSTASSSGRPSGTSYRWPRSSASEWCRGAPSARAF